LGKALYRGWHGVAGLVCISMAFNKYWHSERGIA
jgi:hypothetical protein